MSNPVLVPPFFFFYNFEEPEPLNGTRRTRRDSPVSTFHEGVYWCVEARACVSGVLNVRPGVTTTSRIIPHLNYETAGIRVAE